MSFELVEKKPPRTPRKLSVVSAGIRVVGADHNRKLCAFLFLQPQILEEADIAVGDMFAILLGTGKDAGKVRLDFTQPKQYRDLTLRPEINGKPRLMVLSVRIPFPKIMDKTAPITCSYIIPSPGVVDVELPWDIDPVEDDLEDFIDSFDDEELEEF